MILVVKKKDTTAFKFVQWKSSKHSIKPTIKDSLVYFLVVENDTIMVEYMNGTVGIENTENTVMNIYPTVFRDQLHINYNGQTTSSEISLINMQGQVVVNLRSSHLFNGDNTLKFNDSNLTEGYYYLLIKADNKNYLMKLLYK